MTRPTGPTRAGFRAGFTIIELLMALGVMAILATIAYPAYTAYVIKSRRIEGQVALLETMQQQERFYAQHNTYVPFSADAAGEDAKRFKWYSGSRAAASAYELRGQACPDQPIERCIELRAIPGTSRVDRNYRDEVCQELFLNSAGQYRAGQEKGCWP